MARRKTERLLNLLIMLLAQRRYVPKEQIRRILYPEQSEDAFERMFDRDKEELRSLGVPIEVGTLDVFFDDEVGYRIRPEEFALPVISLSADEAAVLGLAGRVWQHATMAEATTEALRKLRAADIEVDTTGLDLVEPRIAADEPSFDTVWQATQSRTELVFDYRRPGEPTPARRRLQPWGVVRRSGRWYAVGWDVDRRAERVFRLSRIVGTARTSGPSEAFQVPPGTDVRAVVAWRLTPAPDDERAYVLLRSGTGHGLRRTAERVEHEVTGPDRQTGWDRLTLRGDGGRLVDEVLTYGADAYLEGPAPLQDALVSRLRAVAERDA